MIVRRLVLQLLAKCKFTQGNSRLQGGELAPNGKDYTYLIEESSILCVRGIQVY